MTDDHQYNLRQRTQLPIQLGQAVTASSSYLPQPPQSQQLEQSPVKIASSLGQTSSQTEQQYGHQQAPPVPTIRKNTK